MLKIFLADNKDDIVFHRNSFRRLIYIALFLLVVNYLIIANMYWKLLNIKIPPNFATTSDGRVINIYPSA